MSNWVEVGAVDDIPRLGSRVLQTADGDVAIFRAADDTIFALRDSCPHKDGPLSQGIVHGYTVTCPLHNWKISLESGEAQGPDEGCTGRYEVKVDSGRISVELK
ncbi:MAG: nitrite reductase small subunit NirD [Gammaproteobacteria bacterium]|nr:nitrite reductase small subunit NirD [Gammaproteobacteria bacterium]